MITSQLPPHVVPTLPNATQRPSGLIVPGGLTPVTGDSKLVVVTQPLDGSGALDAAKAAHAELAASQGSAAADIVHGAQLELVQGIRNDELRAQAVAAILAGDVATAAKLISQQG